jgi:hypothetical protein
MSQEGNAWLKVPDVRVLNVDQGQESTYRLPVNPLIVKLNQKIDIGNTYKFKIKVKPSVAKGESGYNSPRVRAGSIEIAVHTPNSIPSLFNKTLLVGYENFVALTPAQRSGLKDIYCDCFEFSLIENKISLEDTLINNNLNVFLYHGLANNQLDSFDYIAVYTRPEVFINGANTEELDAFKNNTGSSPLNAFKNNATSIEVNDIMEIDMPGLRLTGGV